MTRARIAAVAIAVPLVLGALMMRPGPEVKVAIAQGQSGRETAAALKRQGVIRSVTVFRVLGKITGLDREIKPGLHKLRKNMGSLGALWRLARDPTELVKIVIPEGFCARQIADRLQANGIISSTEEFMAYVQANRLEGYLFPTTYHMTPGMRAEDAAHMMHMEFRRTVQPEFDKNPPGRLSPQQVVILASIVEREAVLKHEKPTIAAVYLNRLARRKLLEADPTVQYALSEGAYEKGLKPKYGYWKKGLTLKDLKLDSLYNTYQRIGLPPTPICSPGVESIKAVLNPAQTDAIYFVADNTGGHVFNVSYQEHLRAKDKAKKERQAQAAAQQPSRSR